MGYRLRDLALGGDGEGALTASRDVLPKVPILLELQPAAPSSSKRKSAKPDRTEHIHRLI